MIPTPSGPPRTTSLPPSLSLSPCATCMTKPIIALCSRAHASDASSGCSHLQPAAVQRQAEDVAGNSRSELTCKNNYDATWSLSRKPLWTSDMLGVSLIMEGHHALLPMPQAFAPAGNAHDSRVHCSGAASTSGRLAAGSARGAARCPDAPLRP